jgi:hypothetical protein
MHPAGMLPFGRYVKSRSLDTGVSVPGGALRNATNNVIAFTDFSTDSGGWTALGTNGSVSWAPGALTVAGTSTGAGGQFQIGSVTALQSFAYSFWADALSGTVAFGIEAANGTVISQTTPVVAGTGASSGALLVNSSDAGAKFFIYAYPGASGSVTIASFELNRTS